MCQDRKVREDSQLVTACHRQLYRVIFASTLERGGGPKLRDAVRRFASIAALLALLLPGVSALAEGLSAAVLPACCNTAYCPVHHRQMSNLQKDKSNCATMGVPGQTDCSMQACDATSNPIVGTVAVVLVTAVTLRRPISSEAAPSLASQFFPYVSAIPSTPPPRIIPG
jgi:hypothetical protein